MDTLDSYQRHIIELIHSSENPDEIRKEIISYLKSLQKCPSRLKDVPQDSDRAAD